MDRFKFRGWTGSKMLPEQDLTQNSKYWTWLGKNDVKLLQCTGLKDKNEKLIYEGDVILCDFNTRYGIINRRLSVNANIAPLYFYIVSKNGEMFGFEDIHKNIEIIGNIYENPELKGE